MSMFPGFDNLFYMEEESLGNRGFYADLVGDPPLRELLRGEWRPEQPLIARWSMGKGAPSDIAWGTSLAWYYLSTRAQQVFQEHSLSGWTTYPVVLHDKHEEVWPGYAGLVITGRCGPVDKERGELLAEDVGKRFARRVGLYFDHSTWDGSDFFCPEGKNTRKFVTRRVKDVCEDNSIAGFTFTPLTEAVWYP